MFTGAVLGCTKLCEVVTCKGERACCVVEAADHLFELFLSGGAGGIKEFINVHGPQLEFVQWQGDLQ